MATSNLAHLKSKVTAVGAGVDKAAKGNKSRTVELTVQEIHAHLRKIELSLNQLERLIAPSE